MFKYISSAKLNLCVLAQIIGIILVVRATPFALFTGIALFLLGAILYRRELRRVLATRESSKANA